MIDDEDDGNGLDFNSVMRRFGRPDLTTYPNKFGVEADDTSDCIVLQRRPGGRLSTDDALNLAAWIIVATGVFVEDVEELVRKAVECSDRGA